MADNDWKKRLGVVFSTNPDYDYATEPDISAAEPDTLPPERQRLHVRMERAGRKGKTVTLVEGFVGTGDDLVTLSKMLKTKLSTGGSAKNGEIVLQGDRVDETKRLLRAAGYGVKG